MKTKMMIAAAMAATLIAAPALAQSYSRTHSDGPSRATFRSGATFYGTGESVRAERFGDCVVAHDPAGATAYARAPEGSFALTQAARAIEPALTTCRAYLQNWARYDANAVPYHRRAIYWAVERQAQPGT